ncbi:MAG: pantoate--beta-alanine ligase [Candidatus Omnitrophota bacterium]
MNLITKISEMQEFSREAKKEGKTVGFVPTMGYLHEGHLSLVRAAKRECDLAVMSIYVNPMQFGPEEDLDKYPRDMERDKALAEKEGADVIFAPLSGEMYPGGYTTDVDVTGTITETLCGISRPGHFKGVTTIVAKLFNIVSPDKAYLGQKDAQQAVAVKRMVRDLNIPVEVRVMPTVREDDGLAMSSRNSYLSDDQRHQALGLFKALESAKEMISAGEVSAIIIKQKLKSILEEGKDVRVDYVEVVDTDTLEPSDEVQDNTLIAVAAYIGDARLIDNIVIKGAK